jgi:type II secretory pathway component GspD/PulD (secretin)
LHETARDAHLPAARSSTDIFDVKWVLLLVLGVSPAPAFVQGQAPAGPLPPLPLIQLDERRPAADPAALASRIFDLNYLATERTGASTVGGDVGGPGSAATATVSSLTRGDVFAGLSGGVQGLLSERGTFTVDRKAGLLQVTDLPDRLDRVAEYLEAVRDRVYRQVEIDVRIVEVELAAGAQALDWDALSRAGAGAAPGQPAAARAAVRVADAAAFVAALRMQGSVSLVASPRLLSLNNEPAIVRAVTTALPPRDGAAGMSDGIVLSVTPRISADGLVTLSLSPIVAVPAAAADAAPQTRTVHEVDTVAQVTSGETLVVAGVSRDRPVAPRSGWFGRTTPATRARTELLILMTPRIVAP